MADDDNSKPAIPVWQQRAQQQPSPDKTTDDGVKFECTGTPATTDTPTATESGLPAPATPLGALAAEEATSNDASTASQLENMKTFLEDPAVKRAPLEKKRAFFETKGIPTSLIDQVLNVSPPTFTTNDFQTFTESTSPPRPQPQPQLSTPPIITYPEFLHVAHQPPPLITPGRIATTAYVASTLAALLYGLSSYLTTPMAASLAAARHDFSQHTQAKLDDLNARLGALASRIPEPKGSTADADAEAETEASSDLSADSDPTELYHRDIGVQTSPPPSPAPSSAAASLPQQQQQQKTPTTHATSVLSILHSHLSEMLARSEQLEQPNKERQESANALRAYLDTLLYAHPGVYGMWNAGSSSSGPEDGKGGEDVIEEVKREIRGVKGVLLSAKRFPGVAPGRGGG